MKKIVSILIFAFMSSAIFSQSCAGCHDAIAAQAFNNPIVDINNNFIDAKGRNNGFQGRGLNDNNLAAQYLGNFEIAKINFESKSLYVMARVNAITDQVELDLEEGVINLNKNEDLVIKFTKSGKTFECISYLDADGENKKGFFQKISSNPTNVIYKKEILNYKEGREATTGYDKPKPAKYILSENYYLQNNTLQLVNLSTKRKYIRETFPSNAKGILKFIKDNRLSEGKEQDILRLAAHISKLDNLNLGDARGKLAKN